MTTQILTGHISPETAYVVADYPYGFRLRCQMRYWLETKPKQGVRLMAQTSNPKKPGLVWNKPKASTYARFAGCMILDDKGHVTWTRLDEYTAGGEAEAWAAQYGEGVPEAAKPVMQAWVRAKLAYEARGALARPIAPARVGG